MQLNFTSFDLFNVGSADIFHPFFFYTQVRQEDLVRGDRRVRPHKTLGRRIRPSPRWVGRIRPLADGPIKNVSEAGVRDGDHRSTRVQLVTSDEVGDR